MGVTSKPQKPRVAGLQPRHRAAQLIHRVLEDKQSLDGAFEHRGDNQGSPSDHALTQAIVLTCLRRLPTVDHAIAACLDKPLKAKASRAQAILRVLATQVLILGIAHHAAVALAVEDASCTKGAQPLKGLINAVGRRLVREKIQLLADGPAHDLSPWIAARWEAHYGAETAQAIAEAVRAQPALDIAVKPQIEIAKLLEQLAGQDPIGLGGGHIRLRRPGSITNLPGFDEGHWWVQDYAASLPARWLLKELSEHTNCRVLDLCAAPGGKTAQLASAGCQVVAVDQSKARMSRLRENMRRLKLKVETRIGDARSVTFDRPFNAILLDAPCSATGTLRRNPDIGYLRSEEDIATLAELQMELLDHAKSLVVPGGLLAYATCSMEKEEGEDQIERFLTDNPDWHIADSRPPGLPIGAPHSAYGVRTLPNHAIAAGDTAEGMDGFFMALLRAPTR